MVKLKIKLQWIAISADHWNFISRHGPHACPFLHHCFHDSSVKVLHSHWLADPRDWSTKTSSSIRACELIVICLWPAYCSLPIAYLMSWHDKCDQASSTEECELCLWPHWPVCFSPLFIWLLWCMNTPSNTDYTSQAFNATIEFNIVWT